LKQQKEASELSDNQNSITGKIFGKFGKILVNPFVQVSEFVIAIWKV